MTRKFNMSLALAASNEEEDSSTSTRAFKTAFKDKQLAGKKNAP